jgi:hypothetical protein
VIASKEEILIRILKLVRREKKKGVQGIGASVNVVAHEEEFIFPDIRRGLLKEKLNILVLTMQITADDDRRLQDQEGVLRQESFA